MTLLAVFSPTWRRPQVFGSSSDGFIRLSAASVVIPPSDNFVLVLRQSIENCSIIKGKDFASRQRKSLMPTRVTTVSKQMQQQFKKINAIDTKQ